MRDHAEMRRNAEICSDFFNLGGTCETIRNEAGPLFWNHVVVKLSVKGSSDDGAVLKKEILPIKFVRNVLIDFELRERDWVRSKKAVRGVIGITLHPTTAGKFVARVMMPGYDDLDDEEDRQALMKNHAEVEKEIVQMYKGGGGFSWELMQSILFCL